MPGTYFRRSEITDPELNAEWDQWLQENFDLGNYDSYKEKNQSVLPYIDGHPQWVTEVYMPPHLVMKWTTKLKPGS